MRKILGAFCSIMQIVISYCEQQATKKKAQRVHQWSQKYFKNAEKLSIKNAIRRLPEYTLYLAKDFDS